MSKIVQHPEKIENSIDFLNVGFRKAKSQQQSFLKRKPYWEQEEKSSGGSIPVVSSLPVSASNGDLVWCDGLYIYNNGWQRIDKATIQKSSSTETLVSFGFALLPEPEAVYATKTGGGDVYVAVTSSGMRSLVFHAQTPPASYGSAVFAVNAPMEPNKTYKMMFSVNSNQLSKTLRFRVIMDTDYEFDVSTDPNGVGSVVLDVRGSSVVAVLRLYTNESGVSYPCWTACSLFVI